MEEIIFVPQFQCKLHLTLLYSTYVLQNDGQIPSIFCIKMPFFGPTTPIYSPKTAPHYGIARPHLQAPLTPLAR